MRKILILLFAIPVFSYSQEMWFETQFESGAGVDWITDGTYSNLVHNAPPSPWAWRANIPTTVDPSQLSLTTNAREGNYALRITIDSSRERNEPGMQGDTGQAPGTERFGIVFGQEYWLGYSLKIVDLANEGSFQILGQMRGYSNDEANAVGKTNFYTLQANAAGGLTFGFSTDPNEVNNTPSGCAVCSQKMYTTYLDGTDIEYALGEWFDIVLHFKLEWDNTGYLEAWHNGKKFVDISAGPTVYRYDAAGLEVRPYMNHTIGIYTGTGGTGEINVDAYRLWKGAATYETVSPLGLSAGTGLGTPPIITSIGTGKQKTGTAQLISH